MSDKRPQSTDVLIKRLRRVAKWIDGLAEELECPKYRARANTCWQCAARLAELQDKANDAESVIDYSGYDE